MEKLIELLNEREKKEINQTYEWHNLWDFVFADNVQTGENLDSSESASILIAKKYWFIKWLVDNDKIDYNKLEDNNDYWAMKENWANTYKALLMLLSVQDKPIDLLISILK